LIRAKNNISKTRRVGMAAVSVAMVMILDEDKRLQFCQASIEPQARDVP
jgi:hypothetical protein